MHTTSAPPSVCSRHYAHIEHPLRSPFLPICMCVFVSLPACVSVYRSVGRSVCPCLPACLCLSVCLSVCRALSLSLSLSLSLCLCLSLAFPDRPWLPSVDRLSVPITDLTTSPRNLSQHSNSHMDLKLAGDQEADCGGREYSPRWICVHWRPCTGSQCDQVRGW